MVTSVSWRCHSPVHRPCARAPAGDILGNVLLFIFFASAGAAGGPVAAVLSYPALFAFLSILYVVHLGGGKG